MTMKIKIDAYKELIGNYIEKWKYSWQNRLKMDRPKRTEDEAEFLPAALSIQDTPIGPFSSWGMRLIVLICIIGIIGSIVFDLDVIITAPGMVTPNGQIKVIQALETSVDKKIHVQNGQKVMAGDLLLELFIPGIATDSARLEFERDGAFDEIERLKIMQNMINQEKHFFKSESNKDVKANELLNERLTEYNSKKTKAMSDIKKREAEITSANEILIKINQTIPRLEIKVKDYTELEKDGYVSRHSLLDQIQVLEDTKAEAIIQASRIQEAKSSLNEAESILKIIVSEMKRGYLEQQRDYTLKLESADQDLVKFRQRDQLMQLRAPVDGVVSQMTTFSLGGVVQAAQTLMTIVPADQKLEIEAVISNKDIGHLKIGQSTRIKIESYPFTQYGYITGELLNTSADASNDEKLGLVYKARVKLPDQVELNRTFSHPLRAGMSTTIEVNIGKRKVMEYFLSPLTTALQESVRER